MLQFNIYSSLQILTSIIVLHLVALYNLWCIFATWSTLIFIPVLIVSLQYSLSKWYWLSTKNSINAIKIYNNQWQVKIQKQWQEVTLSQVVFFGWIFLKFQSKDKAIVALVATDSLQKTDWHALIVATKINR